VHKDILGPNITIHDPENNQVFEDIIPSYSITVEDGNLDTVWYTLDGGITNITITSLTGTIEESIWEGVSQGTVTIRFYANDTLGHIWSEEVSVIKSSTSEEKGNFWEDLLRQGILIPIVGGIVGTIAGIIIKVLYSRMKKKKASEITTNP